MASTARPGMTNSGSDAARLRIPAATFFMAMPRTAPSYALYATAWLLLVPLQPAAMVAFGVLAATASLFFLVSLGWHVSLSAYLLELVLTMPFLYVLACGRTLDPAICRSSLRLVNAALAVMSVISLIGQGFPFLLPYRDFLPDFYSAGYGMGGGKIVTVVGFFGLLVELVARKPGPRRGKDRRILHGLIAGVNFLAPSYILGIVAGFVAIAVYAPRKWWLFLILMAAISAVAGYVLYRIAGLHMGATVQFEHVPKVYALLITFDAFQDHPLAMLTGFGLGQFSSEPALWVGPSAEVLSSFTPPQIPGLFPAEAHLTYMAPVLTAWGDNHWILSSSFNKPYSSLSVLLAEWGLPASAILYGLMWWRFVSSGTCGRGSLALFIFTVTLFALDLWHDSPWFGTGLLMATGALATGTEPALRRWRKGAPHPARGVQPATPGAVGA